jgi:hypothetical protein
LTRLSNFSRKNIQFPPLSVGLLYACTFSDFDSEFEKVARLRDARGVLDPECEINGISDLTIFITIRDSSNSEESQTKTRIA